MNNDIKKILISSQEIAERIAVMAPEIQKEYVDKPLAVVAVLNGSIMFVADLLREFDIPLTLDFLGASSYRGGVFSQDLKITKVLSSNVANSHVLLIDDILDTGNTMMKLKAQLMEQHPLSIRTCVLLDKPSRRTKPIEADYAAFKIENEFVVGYGLDYLEKYRNLPYIGILKETSI